MSPPDEGGDQQHVPHPEAKPDEEKGEVQNPDQGVNDIGYRRTYTAFVGNPGTKALLRIKLFRSPCTRMTPHSLRCHLRKTRLPQGEEGDPQHELGPLLKPLAELVALVDPDVPHYQGVT